MAARCPVTLGLSAETSGIRPCGGLMIQVSDPEVSSESRINSGRF